MGIGPDGAGLHSEGRRVPHGSSSWAGLLTKRPVPARSRLGHSGADRQLRTLGAFQQEDNSFVFLL